MFVQALKDKGAKFKFDRMSRKKWPDFLVKHGIPFNLTFLEFYYKLVHCGKPAQAEAPTLGENIILKQEAVPNPHGARNTATLEKNMFEQTTFNAHTVYVTQNQGNADSAHCRPKEEPPKPDNQGSSEDVLNETLNEELDQWKAALACTEAASEAKDKKLAETQAQLDAANKLALEFKAAQSKIAARIEELEDKNKQKDDSIQKLNLNAMKRNDEIERLNKKLDEKENSSETLEAKDKQIEELEGTIEFLRGNIKQMEKGFEKMENELAEANAECLKLKSEKENLEKELEKEKAKYKAAEKRIEILMDENEELKRKIKPAPEPVEPKPEPDKPTEELPFEERIKAMSDYELARWKNTNERNLKQGWNTTRFRVEQLQNENKLIVAEMERRKKEPVNQLVAPPAEKPKPSKEAEGYHGEYHLWPESKEYDFYGKSFSSKTKDEFLKIRFGETYGFPEENETLPPGFTRQSLTTARENFVKEAPMTDFIEAPVEKQAMFFFHLSGETQDLLQERFGEESKDWFTEDEEFNARIDELKRNMKEWKTVHYKYFQHYFKTEWKDSAGASYDVNDTELVKSQADAWEAHRKKWLKMLPIEMREFSFCEMDEYVFRNHPDSWVNPENGKVEIREPLTPKLDGKLPFKEEVRYMEDDLLQEQFAYWRDKAANDSSEDNREKLALARAELYARKKKWNAKPERKQEEPVPAKETAPAKVSEDELEAQSLAKIAEDMPNWSDVELNGWLRDCVADCERLSKSSKKADREELERTKTRGKMAEDEISRRKENGETAADEETASGLEEEARLMEDDALVELEQSLMAGMKKEADHDKKEDYREKLRVIRAELKARGQ